MTFLKCRDISGAILRFSETPVNVFLYLRYLGNPGRLSGVCHSVEPRGLWLVANTQVLRGECNVLPYQNWRHESH